jgi:predicted CoA-binding protein
MTAGTTLVLGASPKGERYSNMAVRRLREHGFPVIAVGRREGAIDGQPIVTTVPEGAVVHTVTLYLNAHNQGTWIGQILALTPKRIIFNPGAENPELARAAEAQGIEVLEACTLVMLGTGQY